MKNKISIINKRIVTMLLVLLMVTGMFPIQPISDVLDTSITASAKVVSTGASLTSLSGGDRVKKGNYVYASTTSYVYVGGTLVKTVDSGSVYTASSPLTFNYRNGNKFYFSSGKWNPSVSVSGKTLSYSGSAQKLASGSTDGGTLYYSLDNSSWSTTVPSKTNVGTYTVYYKVVGDDNYNSVSSSSVTSKITPVAPSLTDPKSKNMSYTGSAQQLVTPGSASGGTLYYSLDNSSWSTSVPTATDVGTYTIYYKVTGDSNHTNIGTKTVTSTISPVNASVTSAPKAKTMPYTGSAQQLVTAGTASGGTLKYSLDNSNWSTTIPTGTDVKDYPVYYKVFGDKNHNDTASEKVTSYITKVAPELTPPKAKTMPYNGSAQQLVTAGSVKGGTLYYSLDGTNWATSIPTGTNAKDYDVYYKVTGDSNHTDIAPAKLTSTITKVDPQLTAPKEKAVPYNGSAQELVTAGTAVGGTLQYSTDNTNWSTTIPKGTNAGSYPVYYRVLGDSNHYDIPSTRLESTITKITPTVTAPKNTTHEYNGQSQKLADIPATTTGGTLSYSLDGNSWKNDVPSATAPGKYTIYFKVTGDNNYNDVPAQSVEAEITGRDVQVTPPQGKNLTYNKQAQELVSPGTTSAGTMMYSLDGQNYQNTVPTGINAGNYKIYYTVVGDGIHFTPKTVDSSIAKATPDVTPPKNTIHEYNGQEQYLADTPATTTGGSIEYSLDSNAWQTSIPKAKDINKYKIYYRVVGNTNYNDVPAANVDAEITDVQIEVTPPQGKNLTYNQQPQTLITAGTASKGKMVYSLDRITYSENLPKGTNAGIYTVYYKVIGDGINFTPKSVVATIAKAAPAVTPPSGTSHIYNEQEQPLADTPATTTGGTIKYSLDGDTWQDGIPKAKDIGEYKIYYKVEGDNNYRDVAPQTVNAEITKKPVVIPNATISVLGIDKADTPTVAAYQIIDGVYAKDGTLIKYVPVSELGNLKIQDMTQPTEDELAAISAAIRKGEISLDPIQMTRLEESETPNTVSYTANVEPGMYLVLVSGSKVGYIYNPAVVSINIDDNAYLAVSGSVDMTTYFEFPPKAYIKSSRVKAEKSIIDENGNKTKGWSAAYGETVNFRIDNIVIPSYSHDYTSPTYIITDTLKGSAFDGIKNFAVKIDGVLTLPGNDTFSIVGKDQNGNDIAASITNNAITINNAKSFVLSFAQSYLYDNEGKSVVIDYSSVITNTAGYNYSENQNVVKVEYSNTPDTTAQISDVTYHYTFGISTKIDAEDDNPDPTKNKSRYIIYEICKTSEECYEYEEVTDSEGNIIQKNKKALPGAEFTLYSSYARADSDIVATTVSNEYGGISFAGLKAGTYYLAETKPPAGYSLNETVYRIDIIPTFDERGIMTNYTINTYIAGANGESTAAVQSASYTNTPTVHEDGSVTNDIVIVNNSSSKLAIINTTLALLPSTGGMGTVIITIGASLGMAYFLTMFILNRKKKPF